MKNCHAIGVLGVDVDDLPLSTLKLDVVKLVSKFGSREKQAGSVPSE